MSAHGLEIAETFYVRIEVDPDHPLSVNEQVAHRAIVSTTSQPPDDEALVEIEVTWDTQILCGEGDLEKSRLVPADNRWERSWGPNTEYVRVVKHETILRRIPARRGMRPPSTNVQSIVSVCGGNEVAVGHKVALRS